MNALLLVLRVYLEITVVRTIRTEARSVEMDSLGYIYLLYTDHIEKLDSTGTVLYRSSLLAYGQNYSLDVSDPMKPFLFFRESAVIYPMDNTLSLQGSPLELNQAGLGTIECAGRSRNNQYWVWNSENNDMVRIDRSLVKRASTGNLNVLLGKKLSPSQITEYGGNVLLFDLNEGLFIFDQYGNYASQTKLKGATGIRIGDKAFLFGDSTSIHFLDRTLIGEEVYPLPSPPRSAIAVSGSVIGYMGAGELVICRYADVEGSK